MRPERAWNSEGGIDFHLGDHWRGSGTFFSRNERDDIDYIRLNSSAIWQATNFQKLTFNGWEGALAWSRNGQNVQVQYTGIHGIQAALGGYQSKYAFNFPSQQAVLSWQRTSIHGLQTRLRVGVTNQEQRPAYAACRRVRRLHTIAFPSIPAPDESHGHQLSTSAWRCNARARGSRRS